MMGLSWLERQMKAVMELLTTIQLMEDVMSTELANLTTKVDALQVQVNKTTELQAGVILLIQQLVAAKEDPVALKALADKAVALESQLAGSGQQLSDVVAANTPTTPA